MNKRLIKLEDLKIMNTDIGFIPETGSYISKEIFFDFLEESKQIKKQTIECDKYSFITDLFSIYCAYTKSEEYFIRRGRNFIKQNTNYRMSDDLLETLQNYMNKCDYYNFMDNSFEWEDTDEGYFFWKGVADSIKRK